MDTEKKTIEFQNKPKKRRFNGFPIWVWLLLLAIVFAVYVFMGMKAG